jgi:triosephosphate isomerase
MVIRPLVVGNWKMHGLQAQAAALARHIGRAIGRSRATEVAIAPPFTALPAVHKAIRGSNVRLAAQDLYWQDQGAFTGEISAPMLLDLGCRYVIVGHSERRHIFHESDEDIAQKTAACLRHGLRPILCVGETLAQRRSGSTRRVIARQLVSALKRLGKDAIGQFELAYEPVWAIGTGHNASPEQVRGVHGWIQESFTNILADKGKRVRSRILYGGSVRAENCRSLAHLPEVDGFLVGGASLDLTSFVNIVRSFA